MYEVKVFVARKTASNLTYPFFGNVGERPKLINVAVTVPAAGATALTVQNAPEARYVNPPTAVLDNATGKLYHIIDRNNAVVTLDRPWEDAVGPGLIWLIPPPQSGGKNADIEVYQTVIRF
jgi:hypothetical protein